MGFLSGKRDMLEILVDIRDTLVKLREDVQRAGVMSGLLSRPGGGRIEEVIDAANRIAESIKD